jgi:hypothetical protein
VHGGGLEAISKTFLVPLRKSPMANEIIDQIHLRIPIKTKDQIKNRKLILESSNLLLLEKIKIFDFESNRTS